MIGINALLAIDIDEVSPFYKLKLYHAFKKPTFIEIQDTVISVQ